MVPVANYTATMNRAHRQRSLFPVKLSVLLALVAATGATPQTVDLTSPHLPAGLRYAHDQLRNVTEVPVEASLRLTAAQVPGGRTEEAFALAPQGNGYRVTAADNTGLMYGLLELRDRLEQGRPPTVPLVSSPALHLRGDSLDFPFYLGVDLYNGRWRWHADIERSTDSWWLDRGHWAWRLQRCAELRMNALLLCHPHPFPALIDLPQMPEAGYFEPEHLRRLQDHFRWILDEAEQYGVRIYLLTWNIWVSPGFARAHGIPQEGPQGERVTEYTRACYRRLCETYPKLAGVMTMAGEAPPGCVDFVREAVVPGLNAAPRPPELLFWTWCSYPEDARSVLSAYRGPSAVVHYLQYEQLFRPQADPRIKRTSEALDGVPVVTLGGLGTATGWLCWNDPYYLRDIMADLPRQNAVGCFFQGLDSFGWAAEKWLAWEALGRYWWDPLRPWEDDHWRGRIARRYGVPELADDYLTANIEASSIPTRLLALLHRQTDHFMPQFGLPLIHYLGLPTLSTYVFENHEGIDEQGRLSPRLGLTWPNPDWGEKVIGVVDYVAGAGEGTTPLQIADQLQRAAQIVMDKLARLRTFADRVNGGAQKWNRALDQMQMNAELGLHTAAKIRAAVAWQRLRAGHGEARDVLEPLTASVRAMERMADCADRVYPGTVIHAWRPGISRPLPWTNLQIWRNDRHRKHSFRDSAGLFRRELEWVERELQAGYPQPLLPFEDDLAPKPADARLIMAWDCEGDPPAGLKLNSFGEVATARVGFGSAPEPLVGRRLLAEHRGDNFYFPLTTDPAILPLRIGKAYWVSADYWIVQDAEPLGDWLSAGARTTKGDWPNDIGARYMGGPAGTRGKVTLAFSPHTWDDYYLYVSIHGQARIELDNLEIWEGTPSDPEH